MDNFFGCLMVIILWFAAPLLTLMSGGSGFDFVATVLLPPIFDWVYYFVFVL